VSPSPQAVEVLWLLWVPGVPAWGLVQARNGRPVQRRPPSAFAGTAGV
jgi:hypothetical protein